MSKSRPTVDAKASHSKPDDKKYSQKDSQLLNVSKDVFESRVAEFFDSKDAAQFSKTSKKSRDFVQNKIMRLREPYLKQLKDEKLINEIKHAIRSHNMKELQLTMERYWVCREEKRIDLHRRYKEYYDHPTTCNAYMLTEMMPLLEARMDGHFSDFGYHALKSKNRNAIAYLSKQELYSCYLVEYKAPRVNYMFPLVLDCDAVYVRNGDELYYLRYGNKTPTIITHGKNELKVMYDEIQKSSALPLPKLSESQLEQITRLTGHVRLRAHSSSKIVKTLMNNALQEKMSEHEVSQDLAAIRGSWNSYDPSIQAIYRYLAECASQNAVQNELRFMLQCFIQEQKPQEVGCAAYPYLIRILVSINRPETIDPNLSRLVDPAFSDEKNKLGMKILCAYLNIDDITREKDITTGERYGEIYRPRNYWTQTQQNELQVILNTFKRRASSVEDSVHIVKVFLEAGLIPVNSKDLLLLSEMRDSGVIADTRFGIKRAFVELVKIMITHHKSLRTADSLGLLHKKNYKQLKRFLDDLSSLENDLAGGAPMWLFSLDGYCFFASYLETYYKSLLEHGSIYYKNELLNILSQLTGVDENWCRHMICAPDDPSILAHYISNKREKAMKYELVHGSSAAVSAMTLFAKSKTYHVAMNRQPAKFVDSGSVDPRLVSLAPRKK